MPKALVCQALLAFAAGEGTVCGEIFAPIDLFGLGLLPDLSGFTGINAKEKAKKVLQSQGLQDFFMARREGFEPPAFWSVARRSIQLS